ncbi:MAG: hypothetical protein ACI920_003319, partial [Saprospiraceae bacterium]
METITEEQKEKDSKLIVDAYRRLLKSIKTPMDEADKKNIR